mmetsp:Transcript_24202/g.53920  ORF Transcript_24202/g.53920 Transcript_24202/m.53920 type:complete len:192 (-) Transcript_24202:334-909(-)
MCKGRICIAPTTGGPRFRENKKPGKSMPRHGTPEIVIPEDALLEKEETRGRSSWTVSRSVPIAVATTCLSDSDIDSDTPATPYTQNTNTRTNSTSWSQQHTWPHPPRSGTTAPAVVAAAAAAARPSTRSEQNKLALLSGLCCHGAHKLFSRCKKDVRWVVVWRWCGGGALGRIPFRATCVCICVCVEVPIL